MSEPWYRNGLRFACTQCGKCCTGAPGTVRVDERELRLLARHLEMSEAEFRRDFTFRLPNGDTSLRERSNHDCIFWSRQHGCFVYSLRPRQCRTWPFWRDAVETPEGWEEAARLCPGINQGPLFDAETIRRSAEADGTTGHDG